MIPASHFVHVIQAERERDLERWQRARHARSEEDPSVGDHRWNRLRAALGLRRRLGRHATALVPCDDSVACTACC
jgi:hypothetical protein